MSHCTRTLRLKPGNITESKTGSPAGPRGLEYAQRPVLGSTDIPSTQVVPNVLLTAAAHIIYNSAPRDVSSCSTWMNLPDTSDGPAPV